MPDYRGSSMDGKMPVQRLRSFAVLLGISILTALLGFSAGKRAAAREPEPRLLSLISSGQTVTGETIAYPVGAPAKVTAVIVTLQPGEETGLHTHGVPAFGYVIEGELTVSYADNKVRIYKAGTAVLEAMAVAHNGRNTGQGPMRILAVFMGAGDKPVSDPLKK
jgi:quercetin dioxygenase-like cupin family protein